MGRGTLGTGDATNGSNEYANSGDTCPAAARSLDALGGGRGESLLQGPAYYCREDDDFSFRSSGVVKCLALWGGTRKTEGFGRASEEPCCGRSCEGSAAGEKRGSR